jgi:hypothetical protein
MYSSITVYINLYFVYVLPIQDSLETLSTVLVTGRAATEAIVQQQQHVLLPLNLYFSHYSLQLLYK